MLSFMKVQWSDEAAEASLQTSLHRPAKVFRLVESDQRVSCVPSINPTILVYTRASLPLLPPYYLY